MKHYYIGSNPDNPRFGYRFRVMIHTVGIAAKGFYDLADEVKRTSDAFDNLTSAFRFTLSDRIKLWWSGLFYVTIWDVHGGAK